MIHQKKKAKRRGLARTAETPQRHYESVSFMARDLSEDTAFGEKVARAIENRKLVNSLMALRTAKGLSQGDIAERMQCSQSRVSKLEHSQDDELSIGDLHSYAAALGLEMSIALVKANHKTVKTRSFKAATNSFSNPPAIIETRP